MYIISNDDLGEISMILVGDGDTIDSSNPLISLSKNGYKLEGWYTNEELTKKYDFSTPVTQDFALYAKWVVFADFNNDNVMNISDVVLYRKFIVGLNDVTLNFDKMSINQKNNLDLNGAGVINLPDLVQARQYLATISS